ncbi:MAG: hypothetical protein H7842_01240 [Gammaproteobacteria bacterium SHHR-1]|uniref:hypothetical protein n=1 Tax=Magnetovirga frankeli TaxID=947516 RepID=UPI0012936263|nr:hypothetical protein D5125_09160 [gamma proteobacterium SS-5]
MEIETAETGVLLLKGAGIKAAASKASLLALPKGAFAIGLGTGLLSGVAVVTLGMIAISYVIDRAQQESHSLSIPPL